MERIRYTGGGCIVPRIVVLHFGTGNEDMFMFENGSIAYMLVNIKSEEETYLSDLYNQSVIEKWDENKFIERVTKTIPHSGTLSVTFQ